MTAKGPDIRIGFLALGFEYRITFIGAAVRGDVPTLQVEDRGSTCEPFYVDKGGFNKTTVLHQIHVTSDIDGGFLVPGTPYYTRIAARNAMGVGEWQLARPLAFGVGEGLPESGLGAVAGDALPPQAPPGLPQNVKVYALPDNGTALLVEWYAVDTDNGAPVTSYTIEYTDKEDFEDNDPSVAAYTNVPGQGGRHGNPAYRLGNPPPGLDWKRMQIG